MVNVKEPEAGMWTVKVGFCFESVYYCVWALASDAFLSSLAVIDIAVTQPAQIGFIQKKFFLRTVNYTV